MKKRILALFIVLCMILSMAPAAFAENEADNAVAQIQGGGTYSSLQEAVNAAQSGEETTIIMLGDVNYVGTKSNLQIPATANIILDMNEYTITSEVGWYAVNNEGTLTIQDGTVYATSIDDGYTQSYGIFNNSGDLTLDGVTVDTDKNVVYGEGLYSCDGYWDDDDTWIPSGTASVCIIDCTFDTKYFTIEHKNEESSAVIYSGFFASEPDFKKEFTLAEGAEWDAATYQVVDATKLPKIAEVDGVEYASLDWAIRKAVESGEPMVMLADAERGNVRYNLDSSSGIGAPKSALTIDLNGHTLTLVRRNASPIFSISSNKNGGQLTIQDTSKNADGTLELAYEDNLGGSSSVTSLITVNQNGSFTLESGNVKAVGNGYQSVYSQAVIETVGTSSSDGKPATVTVTSGSVTYEGLPKQTVFEASEASSITVYSGTFSNDVSEYVAEGTASIKIGDSYEVVEGNVDSSVENGMVAAKIGNTYYGTLEAAVNAAQSNDTIQILDDVTVSTAINPRKTLTFEGVTKADGKKPKISGSNGIFSQAGDGQFTLKNLNLEATKDGQWYIYHSANQLKIENCDFTMGKGVTCTGNIIMGEGHLASDTSQYALEFKNNIITANSRVAITGIGNNSVITGNVIDLISEKHGDTDKRTSILSLVAKKGDGPVTITDNTFKNANRALAVDSSTLAASDLTYQENKFIDVRFALEISPKKNADCGTYNINNNYYIFDAEVSEPKIENADAAQDSNHFEFADKDGNSTEYKPTEEDKNLVQNDVYYLDAAMDPDDLNSYTEIKITANPTSMRGKGTVTLTVDRVKLPDAAEIAVTCDIEDVTIVEKGNDTYTVSLPNLTETYTFTAKYIGDDVYDPAEDSCTVEVTRKSSGGSSSSTTYSVSTVKAENGKITVSPAKAEKGDTVTITVTPDKGYEVDEVIVTDKNGKEISVKDKGNGKYTFTMPASKVSIEVSFAPERDKTIVLTLGSTAASVFGTPVVNDVAPVARNNRTMLPIRFIAEALGARVDWDQAQQKVTIVRDTLVIEIFLNSDVAYVGGQPMQLDSPAFAENNRTYLPLRFVAENLGAQVDWDASTQTVTITAN